MIRKKKISEFVLVFYSISLIVYPLTSEFFPEYFDSGMSNYFGIILSVVTLAYSLINGNAKYAERIEGAENVMNSVKTLKRNLTEENLSEQKEKYDKIISQAEYRSDVDFFRTLKQRCKENDVRWYRYKIDINKSYSKEKADIYGKLNNYLSENFPFIQQCKITFEYIWCLLIFAIPIVLFAICFAY